VAAAIAVARNPRRLMVVNQNDFMRQRPTMVDETACARTDRGCSESSASCLVCWRLAPWARTWQLATRRTGISLQPSSTNGRRLGHAAVRKTVFRYSIQRERLEELTFVGSDAAVVRFYSTLTGDDRAPGKTIRSRKIVIVTKRAGAWKVGWGQNTRLADSTPE
jgi:hypothetical protein